MAGGRTGQVDDGARSAGLPRRGALRRGSPLVHAQGLAPSRRSRLLAVPARHAVRNRHRGRRRIFRFRAGILRRRADADERIFSRMSFRQLAARRARPRTWRGAGDRSRSRRHRVVARVAGVRFRGVRILHVVPTYLPATRYGGPIYAVHGLCRALAARGHEVDVFTTNVDGDRDSEVPLGAPVTLDGVRVHYFASSPAGIRRRFYVSPLMRAALANELVDRDIVHLHSVFLWPTYATARAAERARVPYVVSPRGMLVPELIRRKSRLVKSAWIRLVERRTFRHAS